MGIIRDVEMLLWSLLLIASYCHGTHERTESEDRTVSEHQSTGAPSPANISRMIDQLSNADITWGGTLVGLAPTIV